jgi:predicted Rossmann fold nucleotide-binding protein DprA/Smf involved in DNA uptake
LNRYGAAGDVLADLPALTKKAAGKAEPKAPSAGERKREIDTTKKIRAMRETRSPTPVRVDEIVHAVDAPHRLVHAACAELERVGEAVKHVGGSALRAV